VAVGAAVRLGELDGLVDDDAVRNVAAVRQFPCADDEQRALDRRERPELAIDARLDRLQQRFVVGTDAAP